MDGKVQKCFLEEDSKYSKRQIKFFNENNKITEKIRLLLKKEILDKKI